MALLLCPPPRAASPACHSHEPETYYRTRPHYRLPPDFDVDDFYKDDMSQKSRASGLGSAQGFQQFALEGHDGPKKSPKAKLSEEDKERMLRVRRRGACLRCRMLKIKCSDNAPCTPCMESARKGSERKVLSFCYCLRTKFVDVNIFRNDALDLTRPSDLACTLNKILDSTVSPPIADGKEITDTVIEWLSEESSPPRADSIVAMLTSQTCHSSIKDAIGPEVADIFRAFLFSTSVTHTGRLSRLQHAGITPDDLHCISHHAGSELLKRLDRLLSPQALPKADMETTHALLLLVLGTTLAVGYSASALTSPRSSPQPRALLAAQFQQSPSLWVDLKEHLCQMLAHHLIFLVSALGVKFNTVMEERLINRAVRRWDKEEHYVWAENPILPPSGEETLRDRAPSSYYEKGIRHREEDEEEEEEGEEEEAEDTRGQRRNQWPVPFQCPPELKGLPRLGDHKPINRAERSWDREEHFMWGANPKYFDDDYSSNDQDGVDRPESSEEHTATAAPHQPLVAAAGGGRPPPWYPPGGGGGGEQQRQSPEDPGGATQVFKNRRVWLVRPREDENGRVSANVFARVRVDHDRLGTFA